MWFCRLCCEADQSHSMYESLMKMLWFPFHFKSVSTNEPPYDKTNKMTVRPAKTDQPGHPPSMIRVFAVRSMGS